ncbi:MAG: hypothetical protein HKM02_03870, partial [Pseudomonadales bacterium]|nr:hypothetical protein [Pseudomonadales bacterium]
DRSNTLSNANPSPSPVKAEKADIRIAFEQLPLATFIQTVYGSMLKKNIQLDAAVAARTDLVTLRTGEPQTPAQVESIVKLLLKSYGVAVSNLGGFYRFSPDNNVSGYSPQILRGRALPSTPLQLRPIFQLVELNAVRSNSIANWLSLMYGKSVTVQTDMLTNSILLQGQSDDVHSALEAIHVLDQPMMRGRHSLRFNPRFWNANDLATKLVQILNAEGYSADSTSGTNAPILVIPVQTITAVLVFAADESILKHVSDWAENLDKPSSQVDHDKGYFTYQPRYTDAESLAKTLSMFSGLTKAPGQASNPGQIAPGPGGDNSASGSTASGSAAAGAKPGAVLDGKMVVDSATNTLIFRESSQEFSQTLPLLQQMDKPSKSVLIEVTIAEVDLSDTDQLGVEWSMPTQSVGSGLINTATLGGLGIGTGGLSVTALSKAGETRGVLNALASENHAHILSAPSLMVKNGQMASIQVGQQVPVITSQESTTGLTSSPVPNGGVLGGILQSVQYMDTGVILKVKPIIHASGQVDIDVTQEVSNAETTTTGVTASPTISTRKINTQISLMDGQTILMGGLIQTNRTKSESGVPFFRNLPVIGQLFRVDTFNDTKTDLIVMITPYVISTDQDAIAVTQAFRKRLGPWTNFTPPPGKGQLQGDQ